MIKTKSTVAKMKVSPHQLKQKHLCGYLMNRIGSCLSIYNLL